MTNRRMFFAHAGAIGLSVSLMGTTNASTPELDAQDVGAWLDGIMSYGIESGDIAGSVVAVVKDGKVLFQGGYGFADVEKKIPMDPDRVMTRIGSTSKLFTWTAVMQLVEQGKLDLDRNVDDYLDFKVSPPGGKVITLLDLMNHRGGFEEGLKDVLTFDPQQFQSTETYLKTHPRPLLFSAGSVPAYSNYGTALAGYIVQGGSGEPFASYIRDHIFMPLGMRNSTFEQPLPARYAGMMSRGYRSASTAPQPYELITTGPAGAVATTAADMTRFMLAHLQQGSLDGYQMLRTQTTELMHRPSEAAPPGFAAMAHGFFYDVRNGRVLIGHGGDTIFFHTELDLLPEEGVGLFYSFNSRGRDDAVYGLRQKLLDQFLDRYFPSAVTASAPTLPSAVADSRNIQGRYDTSRRVEHGFLSVFYLLQQTVIAAEAQGVIRAPRSFEPGEARFHEVAPDVWQEIGGTRRLALRTVNGISTVLDSEDPSSVLQRAPEHRSARLNLTVLLISAATLLLAVLLWPVAYFVRRHDGTRLAYTEKGRRQRLFLRAAAVFALIWLTAWGLVLAPIASLELDFYTTARDSLIRSLQVAGVVTMVLAAIGVYSFWRVCQLERNWWHRTANGLIAASLLGLIWIGVVGGLISFNLNY
jgi:CubicO group peptidase (beta-lactamase class C family)